MRLALVFALLGCVSSPALAKGHVVKSIPGPDGIWDYARYDGATNRVLIAHGTMVGFVDLAEPTTVRTLAPAQHAHEALPIPGHREIMVTEGDTDAAQLVDSGSGAVRATIPLGKKPDAAIWDSRRNRAIVMNNVGGTISIVDVDTAKVTATITLVPGLEYAAFDPSGLLYVNNEKSNDISIVDLDHGKLVGKVALAGCEGPTGMAWAPKARRIVSSCDGIATIFDPATRKVTAKIKIGGGPDAVITDAARDRLYIPCEDSGTMTVLADTTAGIKLVDVITTAKGARTGAVDPRTGLVYLPVADLHAPTPGAKPVGRPGSFRVLVVDPAA